MRKDRPMHVHRVQKGGKVYKYHRYTRQPLPSDIPEGHPDFIKAYAAADKFRPQPGVETLLDLIRDYKLSARFKSKAPGTQSAYKVWLGHVEGHRISSLPLDALEDRGVKSEFIAFRDRFASKPATAGQVITVLKEVLSFAIEAGVIENNHARGIGKLYEGGNRGELFWRPDETERFLAHCDGDMRRVFILALETGQRRGDLLRMTWANDKGDHIRLTQGKTGRVVEIPLTKLARKTLDDAPHTCLHILTQNGRPWTNHAFDYQFQKARKAAGLEYLHFHDLRGTFVTRCDAVGATTQGICAITGHSETEADRILRAYRSRRQLASATIRRLENEAAPDSVNSALKSVNRASKAL